MRRRERERERERGDKSQREKGARSRGSLAKGENHKRKKKKVLFFLFSAENSGVHPTDCLSSSPLSLALLSPPPEKKKKRRVGEVGGRCGLVHTASSSYPVLCGRSPQTKGAHKRFQTSRLPLSDPFFFSPLFYITSGICVCVSSYLF